MTIPKRIICPTDFTLTAVNAIEYSAKLCQILHKDLRLYSIENYYPFEVVVTGISRGEKIEKASEALTNMCSEVSRIFNINCTFEIETEKRSLEGSITHEAGGENMVVMGTNGIDSLYDYFFGTNALHVAKKSVSPVWIVPSEYMYGDIRRLLFMGEDETMEKTSLALFREILGAYNPKCLFMVNHRKGDRVNTQYDNFIDLNGLEFFNTHVQIKELNAKDIAVSLLNEGLEFEADLIVVGIKLEGIAQSMLSAKEFERICELSDVPILVLYHH